MRGVVLLGKGTLAVRAAGWFRENGYDLQAIVPVFPEPTWTDSLADWAKAAGVPICEHYTQAPAVDLAISIFYDKILHPDYIDANGRVLNLHNAPLPMYRGVNPINWALKNGETSHGVTIHEVTPGIDDGPIVSQVTYSIWPEHDEVRDVLARATEYGWALFTQTMPILDRIQAIPQGPGSCYYSNGDFERLEERSGWTR